MAQSAVLAMGRVGAAMVALVLPIALVRTLDPASVGRYKLFFLMAATLGTLLSFGFPASLYFFLPRHPQQRRTLILRSMAILVLGGVVGAIALELGRPLLASGFHLTEHREVLLAAIYTGVSLPASLLPVLATTDGRMWLATGAIAGFDVMRALAMVGVALRYHRVDLVLAAAAVVATLQVIALALYVTRQPSEPELARKATDASLARAQTTYAFSYQGAIVANLIREQAHAYYVAGVVAPGAYAIYAVGLLQVPFVGALAQSLNDVLIVHGSAMHARRETEALVMLWHRAALGLALLVLPALAILWVFAPELFRVLFGPIYLASVPVFRVSLLLLPMTVPLLHTMLRATGRTVAAARAELLTLVVALGTLPILVGRFGTLGAVSSLVAASLVFQLSGASVLARELERGVATLLPWRALTLLVVVSASSALGARALVGALPPAGRLLLGAPIALAGCIAGSWRAGLVPPEAKARARSLVVRWRHAAASRPQRGRVS
jgi:O-antigen/teichoic acid export membrane protein